MDKNYIILIIAIAAVIIAAAGGIFYLNSNHQIANQGIATHQVDLGVGTFNCSENISYTLAEEEEGYKKFANNNETYMIKIMNFSDSDNSYGSGYQLAIDQQKKYPYEIVNGVKIYNSTANQGEYAGERRYLGIIENSNEHVTISISTPNQNETAEITSSFQLK